MSLPSTLSQYWPFKLRRTPENTYSKLDVGVVVLVTSFVSHLLFRHFEPRGKLSRIVFLVVFPSLLSIPIFHSVSWRLYIDPPLAFITYGTGVVFFTLAYRLSPFHPLAEYPGPLMAKSSKWWAAYINIKGDLHAYRNAHDCYGDVVRIGPNELSIRDASLLLSYSAKVAFLEDHVGMGGLPVAHHRSLGSAIQ